MSETLQIQFIQLSTYLVNVSGNETTVDKILQYRTDYNNRPSHTTSSIPTVPSTTDHLHCEVVHLLFLETHR